MRPHSNVLCMWVFDVCACTYTCLCVSILHVSFRCKHVSTFVCVSAHWWVLHLDIISMLAWVLSKVQESTWQLQSCQASGGEQIRQHLARAMSLTCVYASVDFLITIGSRHCLRVCSRIFLGFTPCEYCLPRWLVTCVEEGALAVLMQRYVCKQCALIFVCTWTSEVPTCVVTETSTCIIVDYVEDIIGGQVHACTCRCLEYSCMHVLMFVSKAICLLSTNQVSFTQTEWHISFSSNVCCLFMYLSLCSHAMSKYVLITWACFRHIHSLQCAYVVCVDSQTWSWRVTKGMCVNVYVLIFVDMLSTHFCWYIISRNEHCDHCHLQMRYQLVWPCCDCGLCLQTKAWALCMILCVCHVSWMHTDLATSVYKTRE